MPMYKKSLLVLLVIAAASAMGAMYGYWTQDEAIPLDAAERAGSPSEPGLTVYVTGAVSQPGIVEVPAEARVLDAVNACGGVLPTADMEGINMAQKLKDGQQVRVPERAEGPADVAGAGTGGSAPATAKGAGAKGPDSVGQVNINTADEQALDTLPGIGPAMAKRIIEYRMTEGMFQSPEDLKKIKGIGNAKYEKLKDRVTV